MMPVGPNVSLTVLPWAATGPANHATVPPSADAPTMNCRRSNPVIAASSLRLPRAPGACFDWQFCRPLSLAQAVEKPGFELPMVMTMLYAPGPLRDRGRRG